MAKHYLLIPFLLLVEVSIAQTDIGKVLVDCMPCLTIQCLDSSMKANDYTLTALDTAGNDFIYKPANKLYQDSTFVKFYFLDSKNFYIAYSTVSITQYIAVYANLTKLGFALDYNYNDGLGSSAHYKSTKYPDVLLEKFDSNDSDVEYDGATVYSFQLINNWPRR